MHNDNSVIVRSLCIGQYNFLKFNVIFTSHLQAELDTEEYIFLEEGDLLGFLFKNGGRGGVGYNFDPGMEDKLQVNTPQLLYCK